MTGLCRIFCVLFICDVSWAATVCRRLTAPSRSEGEVVVYGARLSADTTVFLYHCRLRCRHEDLLVEREEVELIIVSIVFIVL